MEGEASLVQMVSPQKKSGGDMKYWDDLRASKAHRYGPLTFSSALLNQLLDLMGEKHPIHVSDAFAQTTARKGRIVPGGFIHSITSGWIVQHGSPVAIVGLRSMNWDYVRPLYCDVPFYFTTETAHAEEINDRVGLINSVRRVMDEAGKVYAIGRLSAVIMRRTQKSDAAC